MDEQMTVDRLFRIRSLLYRLYGEAAALEKLGTNSVAIMYGRELAEGTLSRHRALLDILKIMGWPNPSDEKMKWPDDLE